MVAAWALKQVVFATRDAAPSASDEFRRHPHAAVRAFRVPLLPTLVHPPGIVTPEVQQHCKCAAVVPIQPQDLPGGGLQVHEAAFHSQMELVHQTVQIEDQATRLSSTLQDHLPASGGCISASVRANNPNSQMLLLLLFLRPLLLLRLLLGILPRLDTQTAQPSRHECPQQMNPPLASDQP